MTTASSTLRQIIEKVLSANEWTSLKDIYSHVEQQLEFDADDLLPEVGNSKQRAWQRNIRNVLKAAEQRLEVERDSRRDAHYRLRISNNSFEIGKTYNRVRELHDHYGGQRQGGISTPADAPLIFLFTGQSGEQYGYSDGWDKDGVFLFTGEGQKGDMTFVRGNLAIRDHVRDGKTLHLYESLGKSRGYRYIGEFTCATWDERRGLDVDENERKTIVFHLVPVNSLEPSSDEPDFDVQSIEELRIEALAASRDAAKAHESDAKRVVYERSKAVKRYVLKRAGGICESCGKAAPFKRQDGSPYLEPHHTRRVSDGGPDHPRWVGAVCPNCHVEIHRGQNGTSKNRDLEQYLKELEE